MESRIQEEWNLLFNDPYPNARVQMQGNSLQKWIATIDGPKETPYEGGTFYILILFPNNYPQEHPLFLMLSKICHINITDKGIICLDILKEAYRPEYRIGHLISCIVVLLANPNPKSAFIGPALDLYKQSIQAYEEETRRKTREGGIISLN
jgi:ubiquitin-conjugating enzyme E2 D